MTPGEYTPGLVLVPRLPASVPEKRKHRRIIGVLGGRVVYSTGGDHNRDCKVESFRRWINRTAARVVTRKETGRL